MIWFTHERDGEKKGRVSELEEQHIQRREIPPCVGQAVWRVIWMQKRCEEFMALGGHPGPGLVKETELDPNGFGKWLKDFRGSVEPDSYFLLRGWGRRIDRDSLHLGGRGRGWGWSLGQRPHFGEEKLRRCHHRGGGIAEGEGEEEPREESASWMLPGTSRDDRWPASWATRKSDQTRTATRTGADKWQNDHKRTNSGEKRSLPEEQKAF